MEPVREIVARAVPPSAPTSTPTRSSRPTGSSASSATGFGEGLFSEWRERSDFVLNQGRHDGAQILVAGPNFGTGSSREHAVWALQGLTGSGP